MLRTLRIRQLAIIEDLNVEFGPGLNLLTGETGAGKSILVDALGLLAGDRSDASAVRAGAHRAVVEAVFQPFRVVPLQEFLQSRGLETEEDGSVVVRREVASSGGGRVFVNGSPGTVSVLRELGERLIQLHGQHQHHSLLSSAHHLELLDQFGGHWKELGSVRRAYDTVIAARERLERLRSGVSDRQERAEDLKRQIREIDAVSPRPGERDRLDSERRRLQHAGEMAELLDEAVRLVYDGEPSATALASVGARRACRLAELDPSLEELARRIEAAQVELQDAGSALRDYREGADFDPRRLEQVESRRAALDKLCLGYGPDEEAALAAREEADRELRGLEDLEGELARARAELAEAVRTYRQEAARLSRARRRAAQRLAPAVESQLRSLALPRARFEVAFSSRPGGESVGDEIDEAAWSPQGAERVEFLLTTNPGEKPRPLVKVASGGELSRVMLSLHVTLEEAGRGRALVFDEVDAGVGGSVADAVGARLAGLARRHQVLCATHLPQVAAYADRHYHVQKRLVGGRTLVEITPLATDDRLDELARMLGGKRASAASRKNAAELLAAAGASPPRSGRRA